MQNSNEYTMLQWADGHVSDYEAQKALLNDYFSLVDRKAELETQLAQIRDQLERITARSGKTQIAGQGTLEITSGALVTSYDKKALDSLLIRLTQNGFAPIAQQIAQCRTESLRSGGLKVTREKAQ